MTSPRRTNPIAAALYVNAALLLAILVVLLSRSSSSLPPILPAAYAQNQPPIAGGAGLFVMPAQLTDRIWGAYVLDADNQTLTCYQYWPGEKVLRLVAARSIKYDHRLSNFNTDPDPGFVKSMLEKEAQAQQHAPAGKPPAETPPSGSPKD